MGFEQTYEPLVAWFPPNQVAMALEGRRMVPQLEPSASASTAAPLPGQREDTLLPTSQLVGLAGRLSRKAQALEQVGETEDQRGAATCSESPQTLAFPPSQHSSQPSLSPRGPGQ